MKKTFAFLGIVGWVWIAMVPPFQGPDESVHFGRALRWEQRILLGFKNPEAAQVAEAACKTQVADLLNRHRTQALRHNPLASYRAPLAEEHLRSSSLYDQGCEGTYGRDLGYYLLTGTILTAVPDSGNLEFYAARGVSWLAMMATLFIAYEAGKLWTGRGRDARLAVLLIGLNPVWMAVSTAVNYDSLSNLWFAAAVWAASSFILKKGPFRTGMTFARAAVVLSILGMLTKTVAIILPVFFLAALWFAPGVKHRRMWIGLGLAGVGAIYMALRKAGVMVDLAERAGNITSFFVVSRWKVAFESFWGGWGFGWLDTAASPAMLGLGAVFILGGFLGILVNLKKIGKNHLIPYGIVCLVLFEGAALLYGMSFIQPNFIEAGFSQGRYYFAVMLPFTLLMVEGWRAWFAGRSRPWEQGWAVVFLVMHLVFLEAMVIPRFYF